MKEKNAILEATDPRIIDEMINDFREEIKRLDGEVFHVSVTTNIDIVKLGEYIADLISKKKKPRLDKNTANLVYTAVVLYRLPEEKDKDHLVIGEPIPTKRHEMRIKRENKEKKKWCTCQRCSQRWAYNYFSHCRCGNNMPPAEVQKEYDEVWGKR